MFEVKKSAELPNEPIVRGVPGQRIYPFNEMSVGDAFMVPADHPGSQRSSRATGPCRAACAAYTHGKKYNMKFQARRQKDGSVRIERIA